MIPGGGHCLGGVCTLSPRLCAFSLGVLLPSHARSCAREDLPYPRPGECGCARECAP